MIIRKNIFENDKLIGQDYQTEKGDWRHKWVSGQSEAFERGSWSGKAKGENMNVWTYLEVPESVETSRYKPSRNF